MRASKARRGQEHKERVVVRALTNRLRALGVLVEKNHGSPYSPAGRPDLDAERDGRCVHIECKRAPSERPTPLQCAVAREKIRHGMTVLCCRGLEDVERVVAAVVGELTGGARAASDIEVFGTADEAKEERGRRRAGDE